MRYKIFDAEGNPVNSIVADEAFVEEHFPGLYEIFPEPPPPDPPLPTSADVDRERDRRIDIGFVFNGVLYQSRPDDRENISGAATTALGAMMAGAQPGDLRWADPDEDFEWIAADNSRHAMDAQTTFAFGQAALTHKKRHIFAASDIKSMDPVPRDFTDSTFWPEA